MVIWVGGWLALTLVFIPLARRSTAPGDAGRLIVGAAHRFQRLSRELVLIVLLTGIFNMIYAGIGRGFGFSTPYVVMLVAKIAAFVAMAVLQAWQTYALLPRYAAALEAGEPGERRFAVATAAGVLLAAAAIFMGLGLRYW